MAPGSTAHQASARDDRRVAPAGGNSALQLALIRLVRKAFRVAQVTQCSSLVPAKPDQGNQTVSALAAIDLANAPMSPIRVTRCPLSRRRGRRTASLVAFTPPAAGGTATRASLLMNGEKEFSGVTEIW